MSVLSYLFSAMGAAWSGLSLRPAFHTGVGQGGENEPCDADRAEREMRILMSHWF